MLNQLVQYLNCEWCDPLFLYIISPANPAQFINLITGKPWSREVRYQLRHLNLRFDISVSKFDADDNDSLLLMSAGMTGENTSSVNKVEF